MLELKTETYIKKIDIDPWIADKFKYPIIFYLARNNDPRALLTTFVILDFSRKELIHIVSYSPENVRKVESHPDEKILKIFLPIYAPHCSIQHKQDETFSTFIENSKFFLRVDRKKNIMRVYTGKDFKCDGLNGPVEFGSTFYKDDQDHSSFYFTSVSGNNNEKKLNFFKAKLDLSKVKNIFNCSSKQRSAPHVTRKIGDYLINSEFTSRKFRKKVTGELINGPDNLMLYVYEDLYKKFCREENREFSRDQFVAENNIVAGNPDLFKLNPGFEKFCEKKGNNFFDICQKNEQYSFEALPGEIFLLNLKDFSRSSANTTFCAPAHFEVDTQTGNIYSSSHNFSAFDKKVYFLGPAALDKFIIVDGRLKKIGTFFNPDAYRFTTHKVFYYKGKSYLCSCGQPNRLFFIDAESMEELYHDDIGEEYLSGQDDILNYLNSYNFELVTIKTMEVSQDGELIFLLDHRYIYFYSFPQRKVILKIPYRALKFIEGLPLENYYKRTTHCDYLI